MRSSSLDEPGTAPARRSLFGRMLMALAVTAVVAVILALTVFPTRVWLDQRDEIADNRSELAELDREVAALTARRDLLRSPSEIERVAREDLRMARPDEDVFVLRQPDQGVPFPSAWPFPGLEGLVDSLVTATP